MRQVQRLLIVKLSSIGDVVHALPVSAALGDAFPHLEITWIVEHVAAPLVLGNPYLHDVIELPAAWRRGGLSRETVRRVRTLRHELRTRHYDVALDLQGLTKSALIARASGAPYRFGSDYLRELAPRILTRIPRRPESLHVVDQLLDVARFLGAPACEVKFPIHVPTDETEQVREMLGDAGILPGRPFVALNPSAGGGGNKGWGAARFAGLIDWLAKEGLPAVIVGARSDSEVAAAVLAGARSRPASLVGRTTLKQLMALLRECALHVCGDTGSAHIAAALGTPVVSIFGRSNPARLAPYGQERYALHHREQCHLSCRRFHEMAPLNSRQKCLRPPPVCLSSVTVDEVAAAAHDALSARSLRK